FWDSRRSLLHSPCVGSACQGGISRFTTFSRMDFAQGRTSLNVINDIGAISPGRWQLMQFLTKIGATSLLKVGAAPVEVFALARLARETTNPAAIRQTNGTKTISRM